MRLLRHLSPSSGRRTVVLFVVLSLGPLALLTISSTTLAERAVRHEVDERVRSTSELSASLVELEMKSIGDLVEAYSTRRLVVAAVGTGDEGGYDEEVLDFQVNQLLSSRAGFRGAFLADTSCSIVSVQPPSPEVIGRNFAFRDWCVGVRASGAPYVSEAYQSAVEGNPRVVAVVAPVWAQGDDGTDEPLAYLAVLYDLSEIQRFVTELEDAQGVALTIIDQRGTVLGAPSGTSQQDSGLYSRRSDPLLDEALAGRSGSTETQVAGEKILAATHPISDLGWVAVAEVPTQEAFAAVGALRSTVLSVAGILALVLFAGAWFLLRALRQRAIAEATVRAAENRTRGILDAASDGFVAMDHDGRITGWNAAAAELFGWTSSEATGRHLSELIVPPEQREAHMRGLQRFLRTGEGRVLNQRVEVEALDRAGRRFPVELAVTAAQENESWTFNAFVHDISERKLTESELAQARDQALEASRLKSEFLANMSHEIRTPMNGVLGMTALLLDTELDRSQRDDAETVLRSGESLLAIINDILDFSKIEAGRLDLETIEFGIQDLVEDVTGLLAMRAAEKGIELVVYVHPDVPAQVKGDPGRVRQIVTNLLSNAVKFTDSGEVVLEVSVEARQPGEATPSLEKILRFEVTDTGIGIDVEHQRTIFQTFTQADSSTTRRYGGTGLGLAISQQLISLMDGEIGVMSSLGTGSTFWFTLPVTIGEPVDHGLRRNDLRGARVLLVDDNAANREMLGRTLASWGVEHESVPDAQSALGALRDAAVACRPFDAALVDLHMPDVDGLTLASQITADPTIASVALVLLTSSGQRGEASLAEAAGMAGYLAKPVHRTQLHSCLATVLGTHADSTGWAPIVTRHQLSEMATRGGTILVAEDNPVNQRVARGMLERLGYQVEVVSNGREAVDAVASSSYDAILMDCQMPEMDGYEATRLIRAIEGATHRTPIVAVTAAAMEKDRQRCFDAGMDDHLPKPLRRDQLAGILEPFVLRGASARDVADSTNHDAHDGAQYDAHDDAQYGVQRTAGHLQSSIRLRLDDMFEGLDGDIEADCADLLRSFLHRAANEIEMVDEALAANDTELVRQRAHSLKGMAANLGVSTVALRAAEVEDAARDGCLDSVGAAGNDLRVALEAARRDILLMFPSCAAPA